MGAAIETGHSMLEILYLKHTYFSESFPYQKTDIQKK